jgi:hypothetical protein
MKLEYNEENRALLASRSVEGMDLEDIMDFAKDCVVMAYEGDEELFHSDAAFFDTL